jgi:hypothetical protein
MQLHIDSGYRFRFLDTHGVFRLFRRMNIKSLALSAAVSSALFLFGCGESPSDSPAHAHDHPHDHGHEHVAPHGGTAVVIGDEAYHVEFVHDPSEGLLDAFVLDGHMEDFIRIKADSFTVQATLGEKEEELKFLAKASAGTGETVGDTSQFTATAEWLKTATNFDAVISLLDVNGTSFTNVNFNFPDGNE